ncbi:MAG: hypothetical protein PHP38_03690, partial [Sphaerochaetaceae bacterium]|nr:hypothetical protein [Sphaerochaetaceae bacterium]
LNTANKANFEPSGYILRVLTLQSHLNDSEALPRWFSSDTVRMKLLRQYFGSYRICLGSGHYNDSVHDDGTEKHGKQI